MTLTRDEPFGHTDLGLAGIINRRDGEQPVFLGPLRRSWGKLVAFGFGAVGLLAGLALLAMIPVLQFMTLGWLMEAEGRLGRGERLRDSIPGLEKMSLLGSAVVGCLILLTPLLILNSYWQDAKLLDSASQTTHELGNWFVFCCFCAIAHGGLAIAAGGGKLRHFFRPIKNVRIVVRRLSAGASPREAVRRGVDFVWGLRLPHYLSLGVQGFLAAVIWLAIPTTLLSLTKQAPGLGFLGGLMLVFVLPYVLVAQARVAAEGDFWAAFRWKEIRQRMRRAPLTTAVAVIVTLGLALPLYGWKVEAIPRDALWLPALFFVVALLPGRLLAGWAHARGSREGSSHWALRLTGFTLVVPAAGFYVFMVFFSQYFVWRGSLGVYAQHAFLLPVAFY